MEALFGGFLGAGSHGGFLRPPGGFLGPPGASWQVPVRLSWGFLRHPGASWSLWLALVSSSCGFWRVLAPSCRPFKGVLASSSRGLGAFWGSLGSLRLPGVFWGLSGLLGVCRGPRSRPVVVFWWVLASSSRGLGGRLRPVGFWTGFLKAGLEEAYLL